MIFQLVSLILAFVHINATPLDDYVWKADSNYGWVDMGPEHSYRGTAGNRGYTAYTLNMTSQRWLTDADFAPDSQSGSIWWHYLVVIVPDEIKWKNNASMWITGGNQGNGPPGQDSEDIIVSAALATSTGMVTGAFFQVPNEHTTFAADPILKSRTEDAIIAYTWDHFLRDSSQPEWLVRFPMVKASIRAMDALTEFMDQKHADLGTRLDYYTVAGASKRGWTTWLVGVVDPARVVAIAPIVLDAINFVAVEHHQWRSYGGWTYALQDYLDMDIMSRLDTPNMALLQQMEDPYFYKERLTMPKMIVNAVLDEFQQPDDTHYWWADMPQPKHFLIAPNAEHSLATGILEVVPAIGAWIQNLVYKERIPTFDWTISAATGEIVATLDADSVVHSATLWYSYSCGVNAWDNNTFRRDWRVAHMDAPCTCGIGAEGYCANLKAVWSKKTLESTTEKGKRVYRAQVDAPGDGRYAGFFIDFKFVNKHAYPVDYSEGYKNMKLDEERHKLDFTRKFPQFGGFPHDFGRFFEFTTEVSIWPNTFPYADCVGSGCSNRTV